MVVTDCDPFCARATIGRKDLRYLARSDGKASTGEFDMSVSVVRLGSARKPHEGLRIGTVRRPPRGVPKEEFSKRDFYDVWLPDLSPTPILVAFALKSADERSWKTFERRFRSEMNKPGPARLLDLLAALSHQASFSVGCYCEKEEHCHRSVLRQLLAERGAKFA